MKYPQILACTLLDEPGNRPRRVTGEEGLDTRCG